MQTFVYVCSLFHGLFKQPKMSQILQNVQTIIKYISSLFKIKTVQTVLLFGDLQKAFRAPQPPDPKQKRHTPPVSQFSCSSDWSLREGGPPGEKEPVFPVSLRWKVELWGGERGLVHVSCLRTKEMD